MNDPYLQKLIVDNNLKILMAHMSADAYRQLEERILREGCHDPIHVWNGRILDGYDRYEICLRHEIAFQVKQLLLKSHEEAVIWICTNRLNQEILPTEMRKYLIGRQYAAEKVQHSRQAGKRNMLPKPKSTGDPHVTAVRVGGYYRINHTTVGTYGAYARTIDVLANKEPEIVPLILSGHIKLTHKNLVDLAKLPKSEVARICCQLHDGESDLLTLGKPKKSMQYRVPTKKQQIRSLNNPLTGSIKNMPIYDADSEISSLALTIPSWISIIDRTCTNADFEKISQAACQKLQMQLSCLNKSIASITLAVKGGVDYE